MTTEVMIDALRDALVAQGYHLCDMRGPDLESWNELYRNCLCNFLVEKIAEEEHVIHVLHSWRVVIYPNGTVISCLPVIIKNIVTAWSAGFAQAG